MPVPEHLRAELCGEKEAEKPPPNSSEVFQVGDTVKAADRRNFGKVIAVSVDGLISVKFTNPVTGSTKTKDFLPDQLTKTESKPQAPAEVPPSMPTVITAKALQAMTFPDPVYIVPDLIPEGCTLLCGKPKVGKSFLALNIGLAVSVGGVALGNIQVSRQTVLYLSLEDRQRRLQQRISETFGPSAWPDSFFMAIEWPVMADGCIELLGQFVDEHPEIKLIIIDVLQKVRGRCTAKDVYAADYEVATGLKAFADARSISVIIIHHLRKTPGADGDILDEVSGSTGLTGAVDTILVLKKDKGKGLLYLRGRDIEEQELSLDRVNGGGWTLIGPADECRMTEARQEILDALTSSEGPLTFKDLQTSTGKDRTNLWKILKRMVQDDLITYSKKFYFLRQQSQPEQPSQQRQQSQQMENVAFVDSPHFSEGNRKSHTGKHSAGFVDFVASVVPDSQKKCADCQHFTFGDSPNLPGRCDNPTPYEGSRVQYPQLQHDCEMFTKGTR